MSTANVSNFPLEFHLRYYSIITNLAATENSQYTVTDQPIQSVEKELPKALHSSLSNVGPFLKKDLGLIFNNEYSQAIPTIQSAIAQLIASNGSTSVSSNAVTLPPVGQIFATVTGAVPAQDDEPAQPANLTLTFPTPGCSVTFAAGDLSAVWTVTFDMSFVITTAVPETPFSLNPVATVDVANAQGPFADNLGAEIDTVGIGLIEIVNAVTGLNIFASIVTEFDSASADFPGDYSIAGLGNQFASLANTLNAAGPTIVGYGFTECEFSLIDGQKLRLTVKHPLDPGPVFSEGVSTGTILGGAPALSSNSTQGPPGASVNLFGQNFPLALDTELPLSWTNTSSGPATGSQVQYWVAGSSDIQTLEVSPAGNMDTYGYSYLLQGLEPNTSYSFIGRCSDDITWSLWSEEVKTFNTSSGSEVTVFLVPASGGSGISLGGAPIPAGTAQWTYTVVIPSDTAPGSYFLAAVSGGQQLAQLAYTVTGAPSPYVAIIDGSTGAIIPNPVVVGGQTVAVLCGDFPAGEVTLEIDGGAQATSTVTVTPPATVGSVVFNQVKIPGAPWSQEQTVIITATNGALTTPPLLIYTVVQAH